MRIAFAAMLAALFFARPVHAQVSSEGIAELIAAHNTYRTSLGLPPLRWSGVLADEAQNWAEHLAQIGTLQHSGPGQNLAWATAGSVSLPQLVNLWGSERRYFQNGNFPDISSTGNWADVGHYSQIVWATTNMVGCGFAEGYGRDYLVCNYDPPGNVMGQRPY